MVKTLKGKDLVPGKLYTFWGRNNTFSWSIFNERPTLMFFNRPNALDLVVKLFPLETFVFLERQESDLRFNPEDQLYDYKIITSGGYVGWMSLHDDDLEYMKISFRECKTHKKK